MARRRAVYQIGITADISEFQQAMNEVFRSLRQLDGGQRGRLIAEDFRQASRAAAELAANLQKAVNMETGKLDLAAFTAQLRRSGRSLTEYRDMLYGAGQAGRDAFLNVATAIGKAEVPLMRSNKLLSDLWITMKNTMKWQLTSTALRGFIGSIQTAFGYSKSLDASLNSIRIVTQQSAEEMAKFAEEANKAAKALSTTTTDYTNAALTYFQQGKIKNFVDKLKKFRGQN